MGETPKLEKPSRLLFADETFPAVREKRGLTKIRLYWVVVERSNLVRVHLQQGVCRTEAEKQHLLAEQAEVKPRNFLWGDAALKKRGADTKECQQENSSCNEGMRYYE